MTEGREGEKNSKKTIVTHTRKHNTNTSVSTLFKKYSL